MNKQVNQSYQRSRKMTWLQHQFRKSYYETPGKGIGQKGRYQKVITSLGTVVLHNTKNAKNNS